jgi:hypothetical protein
MALSEPIEPFRQYLSVSESFAVLQEVERGNPRIVKYLIAGSQDLVVAFSLLAGEEPEKGN